MPNVQVANLEYIRGKDPMFAEALQSIANGLNNTAQQVTADPTSTGSTAPPQISGLSVTAAQGIFDIQITDNNPVYRGINYFVEYSTDIGFTRPTVIDLGASRNHRANFGAQSLYFRAYSAYPTSGASQAVYFGSSAQPTIVAGGGVVSGPPPQPSSGSGTASGNGTQGGQGFGNAPSRGGSAGRGPSLA